MIKNIVMDEVGSYKEKTEIKGLKKYNFFYGLNGTGKTILSNYLKSLEKDNDNSKDGEKFPKCSIEGNQYNNILVYNELFIQENFVKTDEQKGIFNFGKENVEVNRVINKKQKEIQELKERQEKKMKK